MLSGCASCPAVCICSVSTLLSISLAFALGFFATGGGTLAPFFSNSVSFADFVMEESSATRFFWLFELVSGEVAVSITTFLVLFEKIKLAVLEGDLRKSPPSGDVGDCKLRREEGPSFDLAAVLKRMASCRFMEGEEDMAGGDFFVGEITVDEEVGSTMVVWDFEMAGCEVTMAGGDVDVGEVMIRDLLMGF